MSNTHVHSHDKSLETIENTSIYINSNGKVVFVRCLKSHFVDERISEKDLKIHSPHENMEALEKFPYVIM